MSAVGCEPAGKVRRGGGDGIGVVCGCAYCEAGHESCEPGKAEALCCAWSFVYRSNVAVGMSDMESESVLSCGIGVERSYVWVVWNSCNARCTCGSRDVESVWMRRCSCGGGGV